jgi:hypothetical protein
VVGRHPDGVLDALGVIRRARRDDPEGARAGIVLAAAADRSMPLWAAAKARVISVVAARPDPIPMTQGGAETTIACRVDTVGRGQSRSAAHFTLKLLILR